jgi:D-glycero-alpha-D-manno-heptose 1-phosphate guanylyltransferase
VEAIILLGGFGTRLKSVVKDVPKPLAPIDGVPFLTYLLEKLKKNGFHRAILAVGYLGDIILNHFGYDYRNMELVYVFDDEPLGTGGSIKNALNFTNLEYIYVFNGDTFFEADIINVSHPKNILVFCKYLENTARYGSLKIKNKKLIQFIEKGDPFPGFINGGIYLIHRDLFKDYTLPKSFSFEIDFLKKHMDSLNIEVCLSENYFIDIGVPEDYERARKKLSKSYLSR